MSRGIIFDIREFTVHDGPGSRVTVFFKGCPLRCQWCHNPEGLLPEPQPMRDRSGRVHTAGQYIDCAELAQKLKRYAPVLEKLGGGVSISGGEPLFQPQFLLELLQALPPIHTVVQTSGHGDPDAFAQAVKLADLILFDLKLTDPAAHEKYTGVDNSLILQNLKTLHESGRKFIIRMPIIPDVNDTQAHFIRAAALLRDSKDRVSVEVLPYNPLAGAKYAAVGLAPPPMVPEMAPALHHTEILSQMGIPVRVL